MVGSNPPLISYRSILKQETEPERLSLRTLLSFYFYFGVAVRQWKLCTPWENHFEARTKTGREEKWGIWKYIGREWEQRKERCRRNERWLTGGTQLGNHRGSCDASVASLPFSQGRKLKVHCLSVSLKPLSNMHAHAIWTHMHSHPTRGTLPVYSSALPPQMVPPCLVSMPTALSALWMNYDPLPGLIESFSVCFSPGSIWTELCQTRLFIYFEIKYLLGTICTHSWGGEEVHC